MADPISIFPLFVRDQAFPPTAIAEAPDVVVAEEPTVEFEDPPELVAEAPPTIETEPAVDVDDPGSPTVTEG